jgi:hypothetical protein
MHDAYDSHPPLEALESRCPRCDAETDLAGVTCAACGALLLAYRTPAGAMPGTLHSASANSVTSEPPRQLPVLHETRSTSPIGDALRRERESWNPAALARDVPAPAPRAPRFPVPLVTPVPPTPQIPARRESAARMSRLTRTPIAHRHRDIVIACVFVIAYGCLFPPAGPILGLLAAITVGAVLLALDPLPSQSTWQPRRRGELEPDPGATMAMRILAFFGVMAMPATLLSPFDGPVRVLGLVALSGALLFMYRVYRYEADDVVPMSTFERHRVFQIPLIGVLIAAYGTLFWPVGAAVGLAAGFLAVRTLRRLTEDRWEAMARVPEERHSAFSEEGREVSAIAFIGMLAAFMLVYVSVPLPMSASQVMLGLVITGGITGLLFWIAETQ